MWSFIAGLLIGFFIARAGLGRKQHEMGRAAAYAAVESSLAAHLAATQNTAQTVIVSNGRNNDHHDNESTGEFTSPGSISHGPSALRRGSAFLDDVRGDVHKRDVVETRSV